MARPLTKKQQALMKQNFLTALEKSAGIITPACKAVGISRESIRKWRLQDEKFNAAIEEMNEMALDFAETALMKNIQAGDTRAITFYLSTKGRSRGYSEKLSIEGDLTGKRPRIIYEDEIKDANTPE